MQDFALPFPFWRYLELSFEDGSLQLWDLSSAELRDVPPRELANALAVSPDGETLITGGLDGTVRIWDFETLKERHRFQNRNEAIYRIHYSPDGRLLAIQYTGGPTEVWEVGQSNEPTKLGQVSGPHFRCFSRDSKKLVMDDQQSSKVYFYDIESNQFHVTLKDSGGLYLLNPLTPKERWLATHREPDRSWLHDAVSSLSELPYVGRWFTKYDEGEILVWNVATGQVGARFRGVGSYAFSPDGEVLAIARAKGEVQLWQVPDVE